VHQYTQSVIQHEPIKMNHITDFLFRLRNLPAFRRKKTFLPAP
jgi:hypothetical protein